MMCMKYDINMMGKFKRFFQPPLAECEMEVREGQLEQVCSVVPFRVCVIWFG